MGFWPFKRRQRGLGEPPDYFREGMKLANEGKYHEALTSFRLALRRDPEAAPIMEQMAVVYTHIGMPDEAEKFYQQAIDTGRASPAAHYGVAFLCLHRDDTETAKRHLRAFLSRPPQDEGAARHVEHARKTLRELEGSGTDGSDSDTGG